ncbi:lytic polysaccharide monooxygenase [Streptomyces sp. M41]|uniref:lytic polysaccharide monooxygenase auxiliary activity family 9 protein n=1 Tax=Streptomyces sp. M41 TaxID=3059412 RepID=UPI00374D0E09
MTVRHSAAAAAVLGTLSVLILGPVAGQAGAHGSMQNPSSRVSGCYLEGPENPRSAACEAAIEASGKQAFYDWNEVNIPNASGRHRQLIPDGALCSAGRDKYKGLDLPRADWPATAVRPGSFTFRYKATAPHRGHFDLYVTNDDYEPSQPLKWSDLSPSPIASVTDPQLIAGSYQFEGTLPSKQGRHIIYAIWQRSDSPEAFYSCSDVVFGSESGSSPGGGASAPAPGGNTDDPTQGPAPGNDHDCGDSVHPPQGGQGGHASGTAAPARPVPYGAPATALDTTALARTGSPSMLPLLTLCGAAVITCGAVILYVAGRRRR